MILHKRLVIVEIVILFLFAGLLVLFALLVPRSVKASNILFKDIDRNWDTPLIESVSISTSGNCPDTSSAVIYRYGGVQKFNLCQKEGRYTASDQPIPDQGCTEISSGRSNLTKWQLNNVFCIKRYAALSFRTANGRLDNSGNCPEGTRLCGDTGSRLRLVCIENSRNCPVSNLQFVALGTVLPDANTTVIAFNASHELLVRRSGDPLVDVTIQESQICLNSDVPPITPGRNRFPFSVDYKEECKQGADNRYTTVAGVNEETYFRLNNIENVDGLVDVGAVDKKYSYYLQTRLAIGLRPECRELADGGLNLFNDAQNKVNDTLEHCWKLEWAIFAFVVLFGLLSIATFFVKNDLRWPLRIILTLLTLLVFCILAIYWLVNASIATAKLSDFEEGNCSDQTTESILEPARSLYGSGSSVLRWHWWAFFAGLAALFSLLIVAYVHFNKNQQAEGNLQYQAIHSPELIGKVDTRYVQGGGQMQVRQDPFVNMRGGPPVNFESKR